MEIYDERKKYYNILVGFLSSLFLFFAIFMPADNLNFKKILFAVLIFLGINIILTNLLNNKYGFLAFMALIFPVFFILLSYFLGNNIRTAIQIGYPGLYLVLFFLFLDEELCYTKVFINLLKVLAVFIVICGALHYIRALSIYNNIILQYLYSTENAMVGDAGNTSFGLMIFIKSSSLLIILLGYSLSCGDYKWIIISSVALFFSGTRANVFGMALLLIIWLFLWKPEKNKMKIVRWFLLVLFILLFIIVIKSFILYIQAIFIKRSGNDLTRLNYFYDVYELIRRNPSSLILGTGFGSDIYISRYNKFSNIIEASYLDMFRQIGIIGMSFFSYFLIKPIQKINRYFWIVFSYIIYLIIASTNPLLYTSTAYIGYIYIYLITNENYQEKNIRYRIKLK